MNVSLYQAAAALNANSRWQDVISDNLASSSVPGYKKQEITVAAVRAGLMPAGASGSMQPPQFFTIPKATTSTSFLAGTVQPTGSKTDLAIDGKAFFAVKLPNGTTAYTRDGEFQINAQGRLVTKQGYTVLGQAGPIQIDFSNPDPVSVSSSGAVSQGSDQKDTLKLTEFDKPGLLSQIGGGYFVATNRNVHALPNTSTVRQGFLEGSNTSVVGEMANMITAMRGFEANQKVIQIQDERLGRVISDLGTPS